MKTLESQVRRFVMWGYVRIARSRWNRMCDARIVDRVMLMLWQMDLDGLVAVVDALEAAGVAAVLSGGWGVDAAVGRQTRRHYDLDVLIVEDDDSVLHRAAGALSHCGYRRLFERPPTPVVYGSGRLPSRLALYDPAGHFVDLMPIDLQGPLLIKLAKAASPLIATGTLGGRTVRFLDPRAQLVDRERVAHLARRSRTDIPKLQRRLDETGRVAGDRGDD